MAPSIYLDHAATTPVAPEVLEAMLPYFQEFWGNPSSIHRYGRQASEGVDRARESVAQLLHCSPKEVYFTSGGTEADNLAIFGTAMAREDKGKHIITSAIEHHAVSHTCEALQKRGWEITYLPVDATGRVDPEAVRAAIRPDTVLVTIMHANNEVGTVQPIAEIGAICREAKVWFHTDAVQSVGHIPTHVDALNVDMLSLSGHKLYGPKGVGVLYIRRGVRIKPQVFGGGHERGMRSGTENVPGIVGLGRAAELAMAEMVSEAMRQSRLRDKLLDGLTARIPDCFVTGNREHRLPNNASIISKYVEGEAQLLRLDGVGIAASSGSACTSGSLDPSHVLLAMGIPVEFAHGSLRFSLGHGTTEAEIDYVLEQLPPIIETLRAMSPFGPNSACLCESGSCGQ
ncbi:MAG TPA: cysteine desulfurase NifS [Armatimonadota bacterium]|jgi:cysteine desulfurase